MDNDTNGGGVAIESTPLLSEACDIIKRLVAVVNYNNEYDEHECPNGEPPCACCKLVTRAKQFIADNAPRQDRREATYPARECSQSESTKGA